MHHRSTSARTTARRLLAAPALLCMVALSACSGGQSATGTSTPGASAPTEAAAVATTAALSATTTPHQAVAAGILDQAVTQARQAPALGKAADGQVRGWLKAACAAHLAGVSDSQIPVALAQDMQTLGADARAGAQSVVPVARKLLCP
ncbi:hypothetical protein [Arsenicicoccus dermatophilus]|uniref:hypothetical protein n=1 Tax=Arsenicicoccus dermatophilus TaxID=1076331 RepID=UPI0039170C80